MAWHYQQATGFLTDKLGELVSTGYSGAPGHVNDSDAEQTHGVGPCPRGKYILAELIPSDGKLGPDVIALEPEAPFDAFGRTLLRIHGDNFKGDRSASDGCIILDHKTRLAMWASDDHELWVL